MDSYCCWGELNPSFANLRDDEDIQMLEQFKLKFKEITFPYKWHLNSNYVTEKCGRCNLKVL